MIIAFDLSLTATGYARSDGTRGILAPPKGWGGVLRLTWIRNAVLDRSEGCEFVMLEGYAFAAVNQAHQLGELGGVVRVALYDESREYVDVPPASLKLFATGKGNAKKDEMLAAAIRQLAYDGCDHNEADALWLLEMAKARGTELSETKRRALAKLSWPANTQSRPSGPRTGETEA